MNHYTRIEVRKENQRMSIQKKRVVKKFSSNINVKRGISSSYPSLLNSNLHSQTRIFIVSLIWGKDGINIFLDFNWQEKVVFMMKTQLNSNKSLRSQREHLFKKQLDANNHQINVETFLTNKQKEVPIISHIPAAHHLCRH